MRKVRELGYGYYGRVYLAEPGDGDDQSWSSMAVKSVSLDSEVKFLTSLVREARILKRLRGQPYVVKCFGEDVSNEDGGQYCYNMLMEFAPGGSLDDLIERYYEEDRIMPERYVVGYSFMLLKALSEIHRIGLVHCDVKPKNVLVFPSSGKGLERLKLADFGLAKYTWEKGMGKLRGTWYYRAPECGKKGRRQGTAADIWSLGLTVLEMMSAGRCIWKDKEKFELEIPTHVSERGRDFLANCLRMNPESRWTADQLLEHPFISKHIRSFNRSLKLAPEELNKNTTESVPGEFRFQWICTTGLFVAGGRELTSQSSSGSSSSSRLKSSLSISDV